MDASAALGIIQRQGVGKVRHLGTCPPLVGIAGTEEAVGDCKSSGSLNNADIFVKYLGHSLMEQHLKNMYLEYRPSRARNAAQLYYVSKVKSEYTKSKTDVARAMDGINEVKHRDPDQWQQPQRGSALAREHCCFSTKQNLTHEHHIGSKAWQRYRTYAHNLLAIPALGEFVITVWWKTIANPQKPATMFTDKQVDAAVVEEVKVRIRDW